MVTTAANKLGRHAERPASRIQAHFGICSVRSVFASVNEKLHFFKNLLIFYNEFHDLSINR
jgi:hypothetical protein